MGKINDRLMFLLDTKNCIKEAIKSYDINVPSTATFRQYADLIRKIPRIDTIQSLLFSALNRPPEEEAIENTVLRLNEIRENIKSKIRAQGIDISDNIPFSDYDEKIQEIQNNGNVNTVLNEIIGDSDFSGSTLALSEHIKTTKESIKTAIIEKNVQLDSSLAFSAYPDKIREIKTPTVSIPNYFNPDMYHCINILKSQSRLRSTSKCLLMNYTGNPIALKIGGINNYKIETSDGVIYTSEDSSIETEITHTFDSEKCMKSFYSNNQIYWMIIYSDTQNIIQNIPSCEFVCIDNCSLSLTCLEQNGIYNVLTSINSGEFRLESNEDVDNIKTITAAYFNSVSFYGYDNYYFPNVSKIEYLSLEVKTSTESYYQIFDELPKYLSLNWTNCVRGQQMFAYAYPDFKVINIEIPNVTSAYEMFAYCLLVEPPIFDTSNIQDMDSMFSYCESLKRIPVYNTKSVTNMSNMFTCCYKLESVPSLDTSGVVNMSFMFCNCSSLLEIPDMDTSYVTNMNSMFSGCEKITTIPKLDTSRVTDMQRMFEICDELVSIPSLDTANATDMSNMFYGCYKLESVPTLNTSKATNTRAMFTDCSELKTIPSLDTSKVTDMWAMFSGCKNLETVPLTNTSRVKYMSSAFSGCAKLKIIPELDVGNVIDDRYSDAFEGIFGGCVSLEQILLKNIGKTINISASTKYTTEALVTVLNNLKTVSGQTLIMGDINLAKLSDEQKAIALNKGWKLE